MSVKVPAVPSRFDQLSSSGRDKRRLASAVDGDLHRLVRYISSARHHAYLAPVALRALRTVGFVDMPSVHKRVRSQNRRGGRAASSAASSDRSRRLELKISEKPVLQVFSLVPALLAALVLLKLASEY